MIGNNVGDEMERGITGEILVKGDNVMKGYFKQPDETANTINENGWLKTGDLGYMDEDGYIFVTGRIKELIIKGGENIAPREIDEALLDHESVLEAAAFAVPCENYGERVEACVIPRESIKLNLKSLEEHCIKNIGKFKSPDKIHVMKDLPKGPSGKIQRLKLYTLVYPKAKI
jgi:acyl-CoA synthetase (AMP-forming)/AMP-acid ligase II